MGKTESVVSNRRNHVTNRVRKRTVPKPLAARITKFAGSIMKPIDKETDWSKNGNNSIRKKMAHEIRMASIEEGEDFHLQGEVNGNDQKNKKRIGGKTPRRNKGYENVFQGPKGTNEDMEGPRN